VDVKFINIAMRIKLSLLYTSSYPWVCVGSLKVDEGITGAAGRFSFPFTIFPHVSVIEGSRQLLCPSAAGTVTTVGPGWSCTRADIVGQGLTLVMDKRDDVVDSMMIIKLAEIPAFKLELQSMTPSATTTLH